MSRHVLLPHPSDVGFRATGADRYEAMGECVVALAEVLAGAPVEPRERARCAIDGDTAEEIVVRLLEEVLYRLDAHGWLAGGAHVVGRPGGVDVELLGEPFDADRHGLGTHVKAITWHHLRVDETGEGAAITVFVDL